MASLLNPGSYRKSRRRFLPSEERALAKIRLLAKGRKTIASKQAFLYASSQQKKVMWRHDPSNPKRVRVA